jgi:hypothetical protein
MHQVLPRKDALAYIAGRQDGSLVESSLQAGQSQASHGDWWESIDDALFNVMEVWRGEDLSRFESQVKRDGLEGVLAAILHSGFRELPAGVLSDRDFWRYCAAYMYDFIVWRQPTTSVTALYPYFGVKGETLGSADCLPQRMFDRAHIVLTASSGGSADPYALAKFGAADVWISHILRVRNSYAPIVVRELLEGVEASRFKTDSIRELAKDLKRVRSNVLFEVLEREEVKTMVDAAENRVKNRASLALDPGASQR